MRNDSIEDIQGQLTDVLRRLRLARDTGDLNAEIALEPVLNYGIEKWQSMRHGVKVAARPR